MRAILLGVQVTAATLQR